MQTTSPPSNRNILVTGASSGIGRDCAMGLSRRGWRVVATIRDTESAKALRTAGLLTIDMSMDDPDSIREGIDETLDLLDGRIDAAFVNAGYGQFGALETLDWSRFEDQLRVNTLAPWLLARQILPAMRRRGHGRIVFNSSVLGLCALPLRGAYCASKAALEAIADTLRLEVEGSGIHIATIEPGPIRSRFNVNAARHLESLMADTSSGWSAVHEHLLSRLRSDVPLRRLTLEADAILRPLLHAIESPRPRTHYPVTMQTWTLIALRRLLPRAWLHRLLHAASHEDLR